MKEENKKEFLTRNIIKNEITKVAKDTIISTIPLILLSIFLLCLLLYIRTSVTLSEMNFIFLALFGLMAFFAICFFVYIFNYSIKAYFAAKNDKLDIQIEKLILKNDKSLYYKPYVFLEATFNISPFNFGKKMLYFSSNKNYNIPIGKIYTWSEKHSMDYRGVCRWSNIGDEFYVVATEKGNVLFVYNTKLFELQE